MNTKDKKIYQEIEQPISKVDSNTIETPISFVEDGTIETPIVVVKDSSTKQYLLLLIYAKNENTEENLDSPEEIATFEKIIGRDSAREFLINTITSDSTSYMLDIHNSQVLVEGNKLEEAISVYMFLYHIQKNYDDGFDIKDYYNERYDIKED